MDWNVESWLSELDEFGCDPASLNKLLYLNKLCPKLANNIVAGLLKSKADGFNPLATQVDNYSAWLMTTCSNAVMSLEDCGEQKKLIKQ